VILDSLLPWLSLGTGNRGSGRNRDLVVGDLVDWELRHVGCKSLRGPGGKQEWQGSGGRFHHRIQLGRMKDSWVAGDT